MRNNKKRDQYPDRSKNTALMLLVNTGKPDGAKLECKRPTLLFVFFVSFFCRLTRNRVLFGSIKKYLTSLIHYIGTAPFNHDNTESVFGFAIV